jgi:hypothetical protein
LLSGVHAMEIRKLLEWRGVLVFPKIDLTDVEQIQFINTLGTLAKERTGDEVLTISLNPTLQPNAENLRASVY